MIILIWRSFLENESTTRFSTEPLVIRCFESIENEPRPATILNNENDRPLIFSRLFHYWITWSRRLSHGESSWVIFRGSSQFWIVGASSMLCIRTPSFVSIMWGSIVSNSILPNRARKYRWGLPPRKAISFQQTWDGTTAQPTVLWFGARPKQKKEAISFDSKKEGGEGDCGDPLYCLCSPCMNAGRRVNRKALEGTGNISDDPFQDKQFEPLAFLRRAWEIL